jgi:pimeloyl-ACP methyl ester carboxylesterase
MDSFEAQFSVDALRERANENATFIRFGMGQVHYALEGPEDGPVIVMIHGLTTPMRVFEALSAQLTARGYRVLRYDHFGRGFSDNPRGEQTMLHFSRALSGLLEALKLDQEPVHLIGYSMGGGIATHFAASQPDRVASLGLIAPLSFEFDLGTLVDLAVRIPTLGDVLFALTYPMTLRSGAEAERALNSHVSGIVDYQLSQLGRKGFVPAVLSSCRGCYDAPFVQMHEVVASHDIPVRAIWGGNDTVILPSGAQSLTNVNPNAANHIIQLATHAIPYTANLAELTDFIEPRLE